MLAFPLKLKWSGITVFRSHHSGSAYESYGDSLLQSATVDGKLYAFLVISGGHDLVLKMAHQHDRLEAVIFTPTDWHLLRKCPSPVWMVKDQPWPEGGKALVAVNLASEEPYHNALNEKLVKETIELAEQVNHTEVHLVGAYPVTPINIAIELPEFDPSVYNDAIRGQHLLAMKALRQKFGINENMTHVEKGLPEEVIPDLAEHLQAGIVVLGTVGRTGISADQYQTPVELDDEEDGLTTLQ